MAKKNAIGLAQVVFGVECCVLKYLFFLRKINWQYICIMKCFVSMWLFWGLSDGFVTTFFVYQFSHWITIMLIKKWHIQRICSMSSQVISMKSLSFWFMCQLPFLVPQSDEARTSTSFCLIASPVKLCRYYRKLNWAVSVHASIAQHMTGNQC